MPRLTMGYSQWDILQVILMLQILCLQLLHQNVEGTAFVQGSCIHFALRVGVAQIDYSSIHRVVERGVKLND